eukprot:365343-Chlamydomonas_euryale.AAC.5
MRPQDAPRWAREQRRMSRAACSGVSASPRAMLANGMRLSEAHARPPALPPPAAALPRAAALRGACGAGGASCGSSAAVRCGSAGHAACADISSMAAGAGHGMRTDAYGTAALPLHPSTCPTPSASADTPHGTPALPTPASPPPAPPALTPTAAAVPTQPPTGSRPTAGPPPPPPPPPLPPECMRVWTSVLSVPLDSRAASCPSSAAGAAAEACGRVGGSASPARGVGWCGGREGRSAL